MKMSKKRQAIYDKSGGKCWYCGCDLVKGWHADHFEPVRRNPKWATDRGAVAMLNPELNTEANKVPACASCNMMKSSLPIEHFRKQITQFINSLNEYSTQYKFAKRYGLITETSKPVVFWFETGDK